MSDEYVAMVSPGRAALAPANVRVIKKKNPMTKHAQLLKKGLSKIKAKEIKVVKPAKVLKAKVSKKVDPKQAKTVVMKRVKKPTSLIKKVVKAKPPSKKTDKTQEDFPPKVIDAATYAGIKRVAARNNIPCISNDCIVAVQAHITEKLLEFLLHARSNAHYMSKTRTTHSKDLASAARTMMLGDLVCV